MFVCLILLVIFIGIFTASILVFALNGRSLNGKVVGIIKNSPDKILLELDNSIAVGKKTIFKNK